MTVGLLVAASLATLVWAAWMARPAGPHPGRRRTGLVLLGLLAVALDAEATLALLDLPAEPPPPVDPSASAHGQQDWPTLSLGDRVLRGPRALERRPGPPVGTDRPLRILALGDSFTEPQGAPPEAAWPVQLGAAWSTDTAPVEVVNHAVIGLDAFESLALHEVWSAPTQPDVVLLGFVLNDFGGGTLDGLRRWMPIDDFVVDDVGRIPRTGWRTWDLGRRATLARLQTAWVVDDYIDSLDPQRHPDRFQDFEARLHHLVATHGARGAQVVVVVLPLLHGMAGDPFAAARAHVVDAATRAGALAIDAAPAWADRPHAALWASADDHHPNTEAHARLAAFLADRLATPALAMPAPCGAGDRATFEAAADAARWDDAVTALQGWACRSPDDAWTALAAARTLDEAPRSPHAGSARQVRDALLRIAADDGDDTLRDAAAAIGR